MLIGASVLTACATGQRPSFDADQPLLAPTGDPGIDAVLDRLVHTAHRLPLKGESLRKPPEKSAKRGRLDTNDAE